ncbi:chemotaxis protein [Caenispirillum bisanense]|uniref:Chemotaxis protein CheZ n=1 Tax=Caenispirillum bisanense TaxID=414052 RepID=A0A286GLH0_9PROT|nr:chemotaxis protein [Caenispirillum bisanense]SOD96387.1 hypothetical protein SAMN05421508_105299 [Caenispirillum bisanense]
MASTTDQQIANLSAAMLAMAGELRGIVKQSVQEAVREEIARLVESGALIPAGAVAAAAPAPAPEPPPPAPPEPQPDAEPVVDDDHARLLMADNFDLIRLSLAELVERLDLTRDYVAGLAPAAGEQDQITTTTTELNAVINATETATNQILETAEAIQLALDENADRLGVELYQALGSHVIDLMTACGFQDITGQRIAASMHTLLHLDAELRRLVELWEIEEGRARSEIIRNRPGDTREDKHLLHGPQHEGMGMSQDDIDNMMKF